MPSFLIGICLFFFYIFQSMTNAYASNVELVSEAVAKDCAYVPVLMFHSFVEVGENVPDTVVTGEKFREVIVGLKNNGYESVTFKELEEYSKLGKKLPEKPYVITIDDGYEDNYDIAYPILKELNEKATISIIGKYTDDAENSENKRHLTWNKVKEMADSGIFEIGNHSYDMHDLERIGGERNGTIIDKEEKEFDYAKKFCDDIEELSGKIEESCNIKDRIFCYPFGFYDDKTEALLQRMGFSVTLTTEDGINKIEPGRELSLLKRCNITMRTDVDEIIEKWEKAK